MARAALGVIRDWALVERVDAPAALLNAATALVALVVVDLDLELRIPWGCSIPDLVEEIKSHSPFGKINSQITHEPSMTDPSCRLVRVTCNEVDRVHGGPVFPIVQWAASDARHLRLCGCNVIEYGPGEISSLHAVNERVKIDDLEKASAVYAGIMTAYANKDA